MTTSRIWAWQDRAACRGEALSTFFADDGERKDTREATTEKAKAICAGCPVRIECLNYALTRPERIGVWGGLDEDERHSERRRRMRANQADRQAKAG